MAEYKVVRAREGDLEKFLNTMSSQGWELATMSGRNDLGTTDWWLVVLKKDRSL